MHSVSEKAHTILRGFVRIVLLAVSVLLVLTSIVPAPVAAICFGALSALIYRPTRHRVEKFIQRSLSRRTLIGIGGVLFLCGVWATPSSSTDEFAPALAPIRSDGVAVDVSESTPETDVAAGSVSAVSEVAMDAPKEDVMTSDEASVDPAADQKGYATVSRVVDGDTIVIERGGVAETLRLIGMNTPETVDPRRPVECFGREASERAKSLLSGTRVRIEMDTSQGERDKYDRMLAYVFLEDGTHYNERMIREGYAYEYTYNTPYKYQALFKEAQAEAERLGRGLWGADVCAETANSIPAVVEEQKVTPSLSGAFECAVNTYNCTDFTTRAEAQVVYESCGGVSHDVHALDRDADGEACETLP